MDSECFRLLKEADWDRIVLELLDYANKKVRRLSWRTGQSNLLACGKSAEDLAYEATGKVLSGERKWDYKEKPDLLHFLRSVVRSLVNHLAESMDNKTMQSFPHTADGIEVEEMLSMADPDSETGKYLQKSPATPAQLLLEKEQRESEEKVFNELVDSVKDDKELDSLLSCILDGKTKPKQIADIMQIEAGRVYQLQRKLQRRAKSLGKRIDNDI